MPALSPPGVGAGTPRRAGGRRLQLPLLCLFFQGATAILFAIFVRYNRETDAALWHGGNHSNADNEFYFRYPSFQDVHAMVFVGFGFLMVFLHRYGFSSVGFTFLLAAFALQWSTLVQGFLHSFHGSHIHVSVERWASESSLTARVLSPKPPCGPICGAGAASLPRGPVTLGLLAPGRWWGGQWLVLPSAVSCEPGNSVAPAPRPPRMPGYRLATSHPSPPPPADLSMVSADFCAGALLISFGAVLGKTGPAQLLLMALLEVLLFGTNEFVLLDLLGARDAGGSMTIHTFGAYFGLVVSRVLYRPRLEKSKHRQSSTYHSDLFAMIGTIFLWIFWPSFNSAPTSLGDTQHRTALNTYYSLAASTLSTFALSALVGRDGRLDMVHVQNAALAGGVVVGTSGEMMLTPFGALAAGFLAGTVSTLGYKFLTPILESKFKVQDTCGVHNLHGMPGVLGALLGVLVTALTTHQAYGDGLQAVFPLIAEGQRGATSQAVYQLLGLCVTMAFALVGGSLVGFLLRLPFLDSPPDSQCYEDQMCWEVPGECTDEAQVPLSVEEPDTRA